jgi:SAM-dependent methyltransferase
MSAQVNEERLAKRFEAVRHSKTFSNIVRTCKLDQKSVLDIGCSYGEFLAHFGKQSVGISIERTEVEYGKSKGLDIRYGNIESDDFVLNEKFDVIFANNIFEHLYSPHHFLNKIKKYLKPNGVLILGVPCVPKFVSLLRLRKFRGSLAVQHINFFTRDTLQLSVERAGWNIVDVRGFHLFINLLDHLLDFIYPHFYVVAEVDPNFEYSEKRMKELLGYKDVIAPISK